MNSNKTLRLSASASSFAFDPTLIRGYQQTMLLSLFGDTLVRMGDSGAIEPGIAESWHLTERAKGYRVTFKLSPQARFHDGRDVRAGDVSWSLSRHFFTDSTSIVKSYLGVALASTRLSSTGLLDAVEVPDDRTLSIELKGPYPPLLHVLASPAFCILPQDFNRDTPIGSGPYAVEAGVGGRAYDDGKTHLVASPHFSGEGQKFERVTVSILKFKEEILNAFGKGEVDFSLGIPFSEIGPGDMPTDGELVSGTELAITNAFVNMGCPAFSSRDFRRDLAALIELVKSTPELMTRFDRMHSCFLPAGIMRESYYERPALRIIPGEFKEKWAAHSPPKLDIVIAIGFCTFAFKAAFRRIFETAGLEFEFRELKGDPLGQVIVRGEYDLILLPYAGLIADPDGFLDLLDPQGLMKAGQIFEEEYYVIPIAGQRIPALYRKGLKVGAVGAARYLDLRGVGW